jgi:class 3 adenylate cyclase
VTEIPETRYALLGSDRIAYQIVGDGPVDLLLAPLLGDCIDLRWDWPAHVSYLRQLGSFSRLIMFDRRGFGASDPVSGDPLPSWERWADEAQVVLDAVESDRAVVFGQTDSVPTAVMFAAIHPDRCRALILFNAFARLGRAPAFPRGPGEGPGPGMIEALERMWGTEEMAAFGNPEAARDPAYRRWFARSTRLATSPREAAAFLHWLQFTDLRDVLPSIRVPTLVLHRERAQWITPDMGRNLAVRIAGARFYVVPGADGSHFNSPTSETLQYIEQFLEGLHHADQPGRALSVVPDRVLAAILFTDIVGSTMQAAKFGDRKWRELLDRHDTTVRTLVVQHRGRLLKMTGDGVLATFDGPGRAIRCALAMRASLKALGIEIRAGLHTGEVELRGEDIAGIGVHIAARVLERARGGELLTSAAVPLLVAGSGLEFEDRGEHELKGVPGTWRLFTVSS